MPKPASNIPKRRSSKASPPVLKQKQSLPRKARRLNRQPRLPSREVESAETKGNQSGKRAKAVSERAEPLDQGVDHLQAAKRRPQSAPKRRLPAELPKEASGADEPASAQNAFPIVAIGASAGGYEACSVLLKALPVDTGMAFVLVQHLDPAHESKLSQLLAISSKIPVSEIRSNVRVSPNRVYVIPPNRYLTISQGELQLHPRKQAKGPPMPIDHFFSSLARDETNRAIGIILSGTGVDGTLGLKEIKAEGGVTFAQDEKSSKYYGMPGSAIAAGAVDFVLSPGLIARELDRIAQHPTLKKLRVRQAEPPLAEFPDQMAKIFFLISAFNGVDFSQYKQSTLKRRIFRRMVLKKMEDLRQYVAYLHQHPSEVEALFQDILINVTSFFRDGATFQSLKKRILPKLLKTKKAGTPIRIWVPGCSTGEEVYSLAITVHEFVTQIGTNFPIQLFATDISEQAISRARTGIYAEAITSQVSPDRLRRYFLRTDGGYQIAKFIRDMCVFARQNLVDDPPFSKLDVISCRNVLIYLGPVLQKKIIPTFHYALQPGGFLILGTSETIGLFSDLFTLMDKKNKIYSKNIAAARHHEFAFIPQPAEEVVEISMPQTKQEEFETIDLQNHVDHLLLTHYAPSGVVINAGLEVLQFRGKTGPYLEHASGQASLNLVKMAREGLIVDLRTTVTKALRTNDVVRKQSVRFKHNGHKREVTIEVVPFKMTHSHERFFLVLFHDLGVVDARENDKRSKRDGKGPDKSREITRLREEIDTTKESLQSIIEEQEATNEELKSANEEIQSSNEELQSTNEELETAKEELQSTNEELTTLNEELQNRNNELSQVNNDLSNLLSSVNMPMLMLGNDLKIRRFTPLAEKLFNLIPTDIGRRISDINPNISPPNLTELVSEVVDSLNMQEREVQDAEGHWYSLRIRPYRTTENKIDGAVIVLVDIDHSKKALDEIAAVIRQPLLLLGEDLRVLSANEAYCDLFKTAKDKTDGIPFYQLGNGQWNNPTVRPMIDSVLNSNQRLDNLKIEQDFPKIGRRSLFLSARRLYQNNKTSQVVIVTFSEER
jgi:two-component system, chemotaxis family, CheB/CheR fusion protein